MPRGRHEQQQNTERARAKAEASRKALQRDEYTCQFCGTRRNLEVHHLLYRSHGGKDDLDNLLTLCHRCHAAVHERTMRVARNGSLRV